MVINNTMEKEVEMVTVNFSENKDATIEEEIELLKSELNILKNEISMLNQALSV